MAAFDVPPAMLELEITETAFLGDCAANVVVALKALRAAGMTIALDDFGTGFSSLSHLRNFPVDTIKIDRSFVAGLGESAEDRAIVEAILRLGHALGMNTVAEGVETGRRPTICTLTAASWRRASFMRRRSTRPRCRGRSRPLATPRGLPATPPLPHTDTRREAR